MPLGSLSTPLIAELPAPADPAGGVSCAYALAGVTKLPSSPMRTSAKLRYSRYTAEVAATRQWLREATNMLRDLNKRPG
jgi:hypothetical protein